MQHRIVRGSIAHRRDAAVFEHAFDVALQVEEIDRPALRSSSSPASASPHRTPPSNNGCVNPIASLPESNVRVRTNARASVADSRLRSASSPDRATTSCASPTCPATSDSSATRSWRPGSSRSAKRRIDEAVRDRFLITEIREQPLHRGARRHDRAECRPSSSRASRHPHRNSVVSAHATHFFDQIHFALDVEAMARHVDGPDVVVAAFELRSELQTRERARYFVGIGRFANVEIEARPAQIDRSRLGQVLRRHGVDDRTGLSTDDLHATTPSRAPSPRTAGRDPPLARTVGTRRSAIRSVAPCRRSRAAKKTRTRETRRMSRAEMPLRSPPITPAIAIGPFRVGDQQRLGIERHLLAVEQQQRLAAAGAPHDDRILAAPRDRTHASAGRVRASRSS